MDAWLRSWRDGRSSSHGFALITITAFSRGFAAWGRFLAATQGTNLSFLPLFLLLGLWIASGPGEHRSASPPSCKRSCKARRKFRFGGGLGSLGGGCLWERGGCRSPGLSQRLRNTSGGLQSKMCPPPGAEAPTGPASPPATPAEAFWPSMGPPWAAAPSMLGSQKELRD